MKYVDGFLLPIARSKLETYRRVSRVAGAVWRKYGALEYRECAGEDLNTKMGVSFLRRIRAKRSETVVFSWIVYKSRAHRDRVNAKVMKDPRIVKMMGDPASMPFDAKRMAYGGFRVIVDM